MRTTLTLDDDVAIRLERIRRQRGHSLKTVVNDLLRLGLENVEQAPGERRRVTIEPHPAGRCYLPSLDRTHDMLVHGEGDAYR